MTCVNSPYSEEYIAAILREVELLAVHRGDGPMLLILSRASTALVQDGHGFDPVWEPPGK